MIFRACYLTLDINFFIYNGHILISMWYGRYSKIVSIIPHPVLPICFCKATFKLLPSKGRVYFLTLRFRLALGIALTIDEAEVTSSLGFSKKPYILLLLLLKSAPRPHHRPRPPCENPWLACWMMSDHTKKDQLS